MKLHLGCGTKKLPGWVNIDSVAGCKPDLVHDLNNPLPYADESCDEILAEDLLEHFDKYMRVTIMSDWTRVLKVGGTITLRVPDLEKLVWRFVFRKFTWEGFLDTLFGENMWNGRVYIGHYGNHKWGYSKEFVAQFGIEMTSVETKGLNICFTGRKARHLTPQQIDAIIIPSHNNKGIQGAERMPYKVAKDIMNEFKTNSDH
jgi:hypothetical protein